MANGFTGKILRINLTNSTTSEVPTSNYLPKYIGGRGIATRIYWEEIGPEVKAFDPENKLIFMTGPLQGTASPGSGRLCVVGKAPQTYPTESIADSNAGGFFAPQLKFAGWDGIIVEGKAPKPVYIYIKDEQVLILDALPLWGLNTYAAQEEIWRKHGWETKILLIGQAGEHLSRIASIQTESGNGMGQGGFGGVMGSKNLKAIAVRGTGSVEVARPDELLALKEQYRKLVSVRVGETVQGFQGKQMGMSGRAGDLLSDRVLKNSGLGDLVKSGLVKAGFAGCDQCPIHDRLTLKFLDNSLLPWCAQCFETSAYYDSEQKYYGGKPYGKVNYMHTLFTQLYGLNSTEAQDQRGSPVGRFWFWGAIGIIQALAEDGVLTKENTGWPVDKVGSQEFLEAWLRDTAYGQGFGAIMTQGWCRAADYIATHAEFGPDREKALTYTRQVYPMVGNFGGYHNHHNVLASVLEYSTGLYWVVANRDPMTKHKDMDFYSGARALGLMGVAIESDQWLDLLKPIMKKWIGTDKPIEPPGYEDAELAARWWWQANWECDCLQLCDWWQWFRFWTPYTADGICDVETGSKLLSAVTGEDITQNELWAKCEVPWILERAIACREGRRATDDEYTDEFLAIPKDPKGRKFDKAKMRALTDKFYPLVGWNSDGVPTRARLEELDLKDVADDLQARGVL